MKLNRRQALLASTAAIVSVPRAWADERKPAALEIVVDERGFGGASAADIKAVVSSAGHELWQHCPHSEFRIGIRVYSRAEGPITLHKHGEDGRIQIGLSVQGTYWAQCAYQFAHEFCHALAGHTNDWTKCWLDLGHANKWLEEALCETASLFALRAMSKSWESKPPYPNWKSFAPKLADYAKERIDHADHQLPANTSFSTWFRQEERSLRRNGTQRAKNTMIAKELLPLFEATPSGWEAITAFNLTEREPQKELSNLFAQWQKAAPDQAKFLTRVAAVFSA